MVSVNCKQTGTTNGEQDQGRTRVKIRSNGMFALRLKERFIAGYQLAHNKKVDEYLDGGVCTEPSPVYAGE